MNTVPARLRLVLYATVEEARGSRPHAMHHHRPIVDRKIFLEPHGRNIPSSFPFLHRHRQLRFPSSRALFKHGSRSALQHNTSQHNIIIRSAEKSREFEIRHIVPYCTYIRLHHDVVIFFLASKIQYLHFTMT